MARAAHHWGISQTGAGNTYVIAEAERAGTKSSAKPNGQHTAQATPDFKGLNFQDLQVGGLAVTDVKDPEA